TTRDATSRQFLRVGEAQEPLDYSHCLSLDFLEQPGLFSSWRDAFARKVRNFGSGTGEADRAREGNAADPLTPCVDFPQRLPHRLFDDAVPATRRGHVAAWIVDLGHRGSSRNGIALGRDQPCEAHHGGASDEAAQEDDPKLSPPGRAGLPQKPRQRSRERVNPGGHCPRIMLLTESQFNTEEADHDEDLGGSMSITPTFSVHSLPGDQDQRLSSATEQIMNCRLSTRHA